MNNKPLGPYSLAADYKARGMDKYRAWNQFIIDRGLKPEIDAKDFYKIYEGVDGVYAHEFKKPDGFIATHHDEYFNRDCQITVDEYGVWSIVWEDGHTGSYPPCNPPEPGRYTKKVMR